VKGHRWFAATYDLLMRPGDSVLAPVRQFVAGGASGLVLEVGCGTGANLPYYDWERVESLDATEPDPFMLQRARRRASKLPPSARVTFHEAPAEALPFPDAIFDTVVVSLVLCTVDDVEKSLAEVKRVLKGDGVLRLVEHVRGEGLMGRFQDAIQPAWGWCAAGCHPNRRTAEAVRAAGFRLDVERRFSLTLGAPAFVGLARLAPAERPRVGNGAAKE